MFGRTRKSMMALIGYARISTIDQNIESQIAQLNAAGCDIIHEETASGIKHDRRVLNLLLAKMKKGDTLIVVRIDRLARSLPHLLQTIEDLRKKGCHFRSLRDPIDTASPTGLFQLQVMGAVAELERNIIRERTKAGLANARQKGKRIGNPGLIARQPDAMNRMRDGRDATYLNSLIETAEMWLPIVRKLRPQTQWFIVLERVNKAWPANLPKWTQERLLRSVKRMVKEGLAEPELLGSASSHGQVKLAAPQTDHLIQMVAGLRTHHPDLTLRQIGDRMQSMKVPTPRGHAGWKPGSVAYLLKQAEAKGLLKSAA